jgi:polyphosphate kinase
MRDPPEIKFDVPARDVLNELISDAPPCGMRGAPPQRVFHRDLYFDTGDGTLEARGVCCRLRTRSDDTRVLSLEFRQASGRQVHEERVPEVDPRDVLRGNSDPARRLRAIVDPDRLAPTIELETERQRRRVRSGWLPLPLFEFVYDVITVRNEYGAHEFFELEIRHLRRGTPSLEQVVRDLQSRFALRTTLSDKVTRAKKHLERLESHTLAQQVRGNREAAVIATHLGEIALRRAGNELVLPVEQGHGEETCRSLLRAHLGTVEGKVRLLGTAPASGGRLPLEVWVADDLPKSVESPDDDRVTWFAAADVMKRVGSPLLRDARTLAALAVAGRSELFHLTGAPPETGETPDAKASTVSDAGTQTIADLQKPDLPEEALDAWEPVPDQFINEELSWLEFNARVLEMAENPGTPLLARFRFLAIFASNLDEFVMVRIGALKNAVVQGVEKTSLDGLTPQEQLDAISVRLTPLVRRQERCFRKLLPELERHGVPLRTWNELDVPAREAMGAHFEEQIFPVLTPQAMTEAPGHPFPHIANLSLSLAAMVRDEHGGPPHFAHIRLPGGSPRLIPLPDGKGLIPVEEIIRANVASLYPGRQVEGVNVFRITRSGDISVDEEGASNLLQAIEEGVKRRPFGSVVRIEVEKAMPRPLREMLERELQFEEAAPASTLSDADVFEVTTMVDHTALQEVASLALPELDYPSFTPASPLDPNVSIFDQIVEREVLVHHPYDAFKSTVERFILEAVDDPNVIAIKLTLYRSGDQSRIVDGLMRAARAGKEVAVFVELKARFDEERNIHWAKKLEKAGIHVVYGLVRLKTHAKTTLVIRREGDTVRRYVHIGTGNYNAATARFYTDLGLLSCRQKLGADLSDLFNELTGSSRPPQSKFRRLLVAPKRMRKRFLKLIEREAEHARSGHGGRIRVKFNGLADKELIGALYSASQAGVEIDLIVRGICALRPGVPGLSERIRVISILGQFLEHARIYHFENGGEPEFYLGSADWRPRNLRRRVEVVTPVADPNACARLNEILDRELDDPFAWHMNSDGSYARRPAPIGVDRRSAQECWIEGLG